MSTDTLFEQHTIKEIQEIERKLRNDIERKKEELRQMVGERYRDLMEAADTITEMRQTAEKVAYHISCVEEHCEQIRQSSMKSSIMDNVKLKVLERKRQNENLYVIAAMIKILMDCPAKIWSYIESKDYLSALNLYLLSRHTHSLLVLDPSYMRQNLLSAFPVINKQWASTRHFQHVLLQKSREALRSDTIQSENIIGPLCCIFFLSDVSVEQLFQEVLSSRKEIVIKVFKPEKSAKAQVCELIKIIQNTLAVIHTVFYAGYSSSEDIKTNLLQDTIQSIVSKESSGPISLLNSNNSTFQFLGKDIKMYRPMLNTSIAPLDVDYLQKSCQKWIQCLKTDLEKHFCELLNYVTTIKGLSLIREAVENAFQETTQWNVVCEHFLKRSFSLWDYFLRENFLSRIKNIIRTKIETSCDESFKAALKTYTDLQDGKFPKYKESISSYIWAESDTDLAPNLGWIPHYQRHIWDSGTLGMKSYSLTPRIQSICFLLDKSLEDLLIDASCFSPSEKNREFLIEKEMLSSGTGSEKSPDAAVDFEDICSYLTKFSENHFEGLIGRFEDHLELFGKSDTHKNSSGVIFVGHLGRGLTKLCPHMVQCLQCETTSRLSKQFSSGFGTGIREDGSWQKLKQRLLDLSDNAFRKWSGVIIKEIVENFKSEFVVSSETEVLKSLLQWDKIKIKEESEDGTVVESVLRIPQQVSVPLYNALHIFCLESGKIGGHALSSHVRSEIQENFLRLLTEAYREKTEYKWTEDVYSAHLAQTHSLQVFFDVQFLIGLMGAKEKSDDCISSTSQEILSKAVAGIDPFDMDVFSPYLQANLKKALQKSLLLLGLVVLPEQASQLSNLKLSAPNAPDEHNLMLSPSSSSRLPLLPFAPRSATGTLAVSDTVSTVDQPMQAMISRSHSSSPNFSASEGQAGVSKSSSFYDRVTAMSSSWFGSM